MPQKPSTGNKIKISITIDKDILEDFKGSCKLRGQKMSTLLTLLIKKYIEGDTLIEPIAPMPPPEND